MINICILAVPSLAVEKWGILHFQVKFCKGNLMVTVWMKGWINGKWMNTWLYNQIRLECENHYMKRVQIRSFFWSVFSRIRTKCGVNLRIQSEYGTIHTGKNLVFGHFWYSELDQYMKSKHLVYEFDLLLMIWCNANCEKKFSIECLSKLVLSFSYQFFNLTLKSPKTFTRYGLNC